MTLEAKMVRCGAQAAVAATKAMCVHTKRGWREGLCLLDVESESLTVKS